MCRCPLPFTTGDAEQFVRRDIFDGVLGDGEAVTPIGTDLARSILPVPPDGYWRDRISL